MADTEGSLPKKEEVHQYDEQTLAMLEKRCEDAFSGKMKTYTPEESIANLKQQRKQFSQN